MSILGTEADPAQWARPHLCPFLRAQARGRVEDNYTHEPLPDGSCPAGLGAGCGPEPVRSWELRPGSPRLGALSGQKAWLPPWAPRRQPARWLCSALSEPHWSLILAHSHRPSCSSSRHAWGWLCPQRPFLASPCLLPPQGIWGSVRGGRSTPSPNQSLTLCRQLRTPPHSPVHLPRAQPRAGACVRPTLSTCQPGNLQPLLCLEPVSPLNQEGRGVGRGGEGCVAPWLMPAAGRHRCTSLWTPWASSAPALPGCTDRSCGPRQVFLRADHQADA